MFKATGMQMCVSRLMMPAVYIRSNTPTEPSVTEKIDQSPPVTSRPWNVVVRIHCPGLGIAPKTVNPRVTRILLCLYSPVHRGFAACAMIQDSGCMYVIKIYNVCTGMSYRVTYSSRKGAQCHTVHVHERCGRLDADDVF